MIHIYILMCVYIYIYIYIYEDVDGIMTTDPRGVPGAKASETEGNMCV